MFDQDVLALAPLWYVAFLFQLTCHEAGHALAAKLGGDDTAAQGGILTLNPLPHIRREPFGTVLVPGLSLLLAGWMVGWGSAPYDPYWQRRHPHRAAWMALAGPAANLALALLTAVVIYAGFAGGWLTFPGRVGLTSLVSGSGGDVAEAAGTFLSIFFSLNLLLMTFNLLPVPPLDGATAIGLLLPQDKALKLLDFWQQPGFSLLGIVLAWHFFGDLFYPVFGVAVRMLYWPLT